MPNSRPGHNNLCEVGTSGDGDGVKVVLVGSGGRVKV